MEFQDGDETDVIDDSRDVHIGSSTDLQQNELSESQNNGASNTTENDVSNNTQNDVSNATEDQNSISSSASEFSQLRLLILNNILTPPMMSSLQIDRRNSESQNDNSSPQGDTDQTANTDPPRSNQFTGPARLTPTLTLNAQNTLQSLVSLALPNNAGRVFHTYFEPSGSSFQGLYFDGAGAESDVQDLESQEMNMGSNSVFVQPEVLYYHYANSVGVGFLRHLSIKQKWECSKRLHKIWLQECESVLNTVSKTEENLGCTDRVVFRSCRSSTIPAILSIRSIENNHVVRTLSVEARKNTKRSKWIPMTAGDDSPDHRSPETMLKQLSTGFWKDIESQYKTYRSAILDQELSNGIYDRDESSVSFDMNTLSECTLGKSQKRGEVKSVRPFPSRISECYDNPSSPNQSDFELRTLSSVSYAPNRPFDESKNVDEERSSKSDFPKRTSHNNDSVSVCDLTDYELKYRTSISARHPLKQPTSTQGFLCGARRDRNDTRRLEYNFDFSKRHSVVKHYAEALSVGSKPRRLYSYANSFPEYVCFSHPQLRQMLRNISDQEVCFCTYSRNGHLIARRYNVNSGESKDYNFADANGIFISCFQAEHGLIGIGTLISLVRISRLSDGKQIFNRRINASLISPMEIVNCIEFLKIPGLGVCDDNIHMLSCSNDKHVSEWSLITSNARLWNLKMNWCVNNISASPNGNLIIALGDAPEVAIVSRKDRTVIQMLSGHQHYGFTSSWHPDGFIFATGNQDNTCRVWDLRHTRSCLAALAFPVRSVQFSPDGETLMFCEERQFVHLYDVKSSFQKYQSLNLGEIEISGSCFSSNSEYLYIGTPNESIGLSRFSKHRPCPYIMANETEAAIDSRISQDTCQTEGQFQEIEEFQEVDDRNFYRNWKYTRR